MRAEDTKISETPEYRAHVETIRREVTGIIRRHIDKYGTSGREHTDDIIVGVSRALNYSSAAEIAQVVESCFEGAMMDASREALKKLPPFLKPK